MIGTIDIRVQAAKPNFPLDKIRAFLNSPSSLRLRNVPREIGKWKITEVFVSANYPDNATVSVKAVETAGIYVATLPASTVAGSSVNGYTVTANGIDENGNAVEGYVLGRGDVFVLDIDGSITIGETTYYLHLLDAKPATPHRGDLVQTADGWQLYNGTKWVEFGSGSGATVLTVGGGKIYKGGVELTSYTALLALVQAGGVTLMGTVGADKDALYYPLFCDTNAIRFDATGTLGGDVKTKSYTVQPVNGDHIRVSEGALVDLAKKSDIPAVVAPSSYTAFRNGKAADEGYVKKALSEKVVALTDDGKTIEITAIEQGWRLILREGGEVLNEIIIPKGEDAESILALVSQLSGITAQDITDFLNYKGEYTGESDEGLSVYNDGDIIYVSNSHAWGNAPKEGYYRIGYYEDVGKQPDFIENGVTDGFKRLIDLFGESNSQLKSMIRGQFKAGDNVSITEDTDGKMKISATGGGGEIPDYTLAWNPETGKPGYYTKD